MYQYPDYLRGYSGNRVHAVKPLDGDPNPTQHGHGPRNAICGTRVAVKSVPWNDRVPHSCKRCLKIASTHSH
jgi:hypothetical protein